MNLWVLTIGSSDVQLISDKANQAKGRSEHKRSDKIWSYWYTDDLRAECDYIPFEPKQAFRNSGESYRISPRILGRVFQASDQSRQNEIWDYLTFPLLDNFVQELKNHPKLGAITVLLTDQSMIFDGDQRRKPNSPYWQDTCELKLILQNYFANQFPDARCEFIPLVPSSETESLENWNAVLDLVGQKFRDLTISGQPIQLNLGENVYVSHQAGTPALSSALQFCSLAEFGNFTRFLISYEDKERPSHIVESSSYLRGLKKEQAKRLLMQHEYAVVKDLVVEYLNEDIQKLLDAAIQWNYSKYDLFLETVESLEGQDFIDIVEKIKKRSQYWWWIAYEELYLAIVRYNQGNVVEAFFHAFRAFEGVFAAWSNYYFNRGEEKHVEMHRGKLNLNKSVLLDPRNYFSSAKFNRENNPQNDLAKLKCDLENSDNGLILLDLQTICKLFRACRNEYKQECPGLKIFWDSVPEKNVCKKRNFIVHQIQGMLETDLWEFWDVESLKAWKIKLLDLLNFIVDDRSEATFDSIEHASLMFTVHQHLETAIAKL